MIEVGIHPACPNHRHSTGRTLLQRSRHWLCQEIWTIIGNQMRQVKPGSARPNTRHIVPVTTVLSTVPPPFSSTQPREKRVQLSPC